MLVIAYDGSLEGGRDHTPTSFNLAEHSWYIGMHWHLLKGMYGGRPEDI
jgi:hypothetical protein